MLIACAINVNVTAHLPQCKMLGYVSKLWHMVKQKTLKHTLVGLYKNVFDEFNVGHCGIKVKVTKVLAKFSHLIFQITSRGLYIAVK